MVRNITGLGKSNPNNKMTTVKAVLEIAILANIFTNLAFDSNLAISKL